MMTTLEYETLLVRMRATAKLRTRLSSPNPTIEDLRDAYLLLVIEELATLHKEIATLHTRLYELERKPIGGIDT